MTTRTIPRKKVFFRETLSRSNAHIDNAAYLLREASVEAGIAAGELATGLEILEGWIPFRDAAPDDVTHVDTLKEVMSTARTRVGAAADTLREASIDTAIAAAELAITVKAFDAYPTPVDELPRTGT